jgi:hypothetical protein
VLVVQTFLAQDLCTFDGVFGSNFRMCWVQMKTDRIRTDITDIIFVFIFMSGFEFEYG